MPNSSLKQQVHSFWDAESCGERYATKGTGDESYEAQRTRRYELEPYIFDFARFKEGKDKDVLEIGVGMGADFMEWANSNPRSLNGVDLTSRAVEHTSRRVKDARLSSPRVNLEVADAESLPFSDASFDIVYSWGVLHHSPHTSVAIAEVHRVLRPGGIARIMIYHFWSITGLLLWLRYGLLSGHPFRSLSTVYHQYLESPGTKAYTVSEGQALFRAFSRVEIDRQLSCGDLLEEGTGARHSGPLLRVARRVWPRRFLRAFGRRLGLYLMIEAVR